MLVQLNDQALAPRAAAEATTEDRVSVLIPVLREEPALAETYRAYKEALEDRPGTLEFVFIVDRETSRARAVLSRLKEAGEPLSIVVLSRTDGEMGAVHGGLRHARGGTVLTLPAHLQVEPADLPRLLAELAECDMVVASRKTPAGGVLGRLQTTTFHWLIKSLFGHAFTDLACRVRVCRRQILEEIVGDSDQQHFLPLLASERGFKIREVAVRQRRGNGPVGPGRLKPLARARLVLDVLALFVILKLIRKPLRFFGAIGLPIFALGLLYTAVLAAERLFLGEGLADRPALILGVLLIVLGIQVIALGLVGEIIIFASGKRIKDYTIEKII